MTRFLLFAVVIAFVASRSDGYQPPRIGDRIRDRLGPPAPADTLKDATNVVTDLAKLPEKGVPPALLADAHGVVVIPHVVKAGLVVAGQGGHGVVLARKADRTWGDPVFVNFGGGSVGFQVGVQAADVLLVFRDRKSLDRILDGKGKLTLGADASVAAGPIGRQVQGGTDAALKAEIVSYSRSRGLFAGIAIDGAVLRPDEKSNTAFKADNRPETMQPLADLKNAIETASVEKK